MAHTESYTDSPTDICNLALDILKQENIDDIDDTDDNLAVLCARHYDDVRRQVLRAHPWNFAKTEKVISVDELIDGDTGTDDGDMSDNGGLSAAFDEDYNKLSEDCAALLTAEAGGPAYIGKDWGAGTTKIVTGFRLYGSNNQGFIATDYPLVTLTLQGSNDDSTWTDLAEVTTQDSNSVKVIEHDDVTITSAYRYHQVKITHGGDTARAIYVAQCEFYENGHLKPIDFDDAYLLPSDFIRLVSVGDIMQGTKNNAYDIRSLADGGTYRKYICLNNSNSDSLTIMYIRNVTTVTQFDSLFIKLFSIELAKAIGTRLTLKPSIWAEIKNMLNETKLEARGIDGQERPPVRIRNSKILNARKYAFRNNRFTQVEFGDDS